MAEYKSGYKRKGNDDRFFTYLIISFAALVLVILSGIAIYRIINPVLSYEDFEPYTIQRYSQITEMSEDQYLVYYYGESCSHCKDIKQTVLNFTNENDAGVRVYLLESSTDDFSNNNVVHPVTGVAMTGTPSMITVRNGVIVDLNVGKDLVLDLMDKINDGTYNRLD